MKWFLTPFRKQRSLIVRIYAFEDAGVGRLSPLTLTRPAFDLRCGARTLLERQERHFAARAAGALVRPELAELARLAFPSLHINDPERSTRGVLLVNARWLVPAEPAAVPVSSEVGLVDDEVVYVALPGDTLGDLTVQNLSWGLAEWRRSLPHSAAGGTLIGHPWDLVEHNAAALEADYQAVAGQRRAGRFDGVSLLGPAERFLADPSARVEPHTLIDTRNGPVLLDRGVLVQAFSRLEGPCHVGADTQVHAGRVRGSSFGPQCRIGGEVEASIVQGFSNKAHEGFLGHSYVGEWVNLGAGSYTSDLRNDYDVVNMVVGGQKIATGMRKVGSFLGDHTKASIGCLFNTGSLIGPFGQLVTNGSLLPRFLPAFCQVSNGRVQERTDLRQMFSTAATVLGRRGQTWTETHAEFFLALYERTAAERRQLLRDNEQRRLRRVV
jgi:UDP-N-acetylglucosamine diphosphorylase/glucosamine-1-phosphate N-acetyltransferase